MATLEPREQQTIYESVRDRIKGKIPGLSNFTETSFNWVWTQGFAAEFREREIDKVAAYLSGLVDYAGGPISDEDLEELGIDDLVTAEEINERLEDDNLEELVKIVGVERDEGTLATGVVTFTTQSASTSIPSGTSVGTQPDSSGEFFEFVTTEAVSTGTGVTEVNANIEATEVGTDYNVGGGNPGSITYLPNPPAGVQAVNNDEATGGGEDRETNDELRARAKNAIFTSSGGGTVEGVKGYIDEEVDNVDEVDIIEFFEGDAWHGTYPHAHVVVSGGVESEVLDAIDEARPVAVEHILVRPESFEIRVDAEFEGTDIDTTDDVPNSIEDYIGELGLSDEFVEVKLIQAMLNADSDIEDIPLLDVFIENETEFYDSGVSEYSLEFGSQMDDDGIETVIGEVNGSTFIFTEPFDYDEWNTSAGNKTTPHDALTFQNESIQAVADDGGVQTTETTAANNNTADDMTLLPATPAVGDAYYFGGSVTFDDITLIISTAGSGDWNVIWEYWDGTVWSSLPDVDDETNDFTSGGSRNVSWTEPDDWATTTVNSIASTYWVRARVDTFTSISTQPLGQSAGGRVPDIDTGLTKTLTFESGTDKYIVDDAMITDGITQVTGQLNNASHTFTEVTDYEEIDVRADGIINGIYWGQGGDTPDDGTDFTVTYDAGTGFNVTYLLEEDSDIDFGKTNLPIVGTINLTVV